MRERERRRETERERRRERETERERRRERRRERESCYQSRNVCNLIPLLKFPDRVT